MAIKKARVKKDDKLGKKSHITHGYTRTTEYQNDSSYVKRWDSHGRKEEAFKIISSCKFGGLNYDDTKQVLYDSGLLYDNDAFHPETYNAIIASYNKEIFANKPLPDTASRLISMDLASRAMSGNAEALKQYIDLNKEVLTYLLQGTLGLKAKSENEKGSDSGGVSQNTLKTVSALFTALEKVSEPEKVVDEDE